jgi:environmental stress-induced protein Ves
MHIIRRSSFKAVPWKNGGGITHEVIRTPTATASASTSESASTERQPFSWRVSVAQIDAAGPFSEFPDHHRIMVLLRGGGVRLTFSGHGSSGLRSVGDWVEFDGGWQTHCDLIDGPCTDLNLMVNKSLPPAHARLLHLGESRALYDTALTLLFPINGAVSVRGDAALARLDAWDFAMVPAGERLTLERAPADGGPILVFCATLTQGV